MKNESDKRRADRAASYVRARDRAVNAPFGRRSANRPADGKTFRHTMTGLLAVSIFAVSPLSAWAADIRLAEAARQNDRAAVLTLLEQKADINAPLPDGTTALHWAASNNDGKLVAELLKAGADYRAATRIGSVTPLALACENGAAAAVAALLKAGADANLPDCNGATPLMFAAGSGNAAAVEILLNHGANPNAQEKIHGQTALMFAAAKNRAEVIRLLIRRGADPKIASTVIKLNRLPTDEDGTVVKTRPSARQEPIIAYTLDDGTVPEASAKTVGTSELEAQDAAAAPKRRRRGQQANSAAGNEGGTSADTAASGAGEAANAADGQATGRRGGRGTRGTQTAAALAAVARRASALVSGGNTALTLAAREGHLEAIQALIVSGADINQPNAGDKATPLVTAICNGHYGAAKYLLDYGADPNLASVDGLAALYATIDAQWQPVGWAPNAITNQEPLTHLELMQAILEKKGDVNARLTKKLWFRPTHHDECWIGSAGATAFWRAAQATDIAAMRLLIAHGADPKIATNEGVNALMVAAGLGWNGNFSTQGPDTALDAVKYCLLLGLDPTPQDVQGYTALAGAAYRGDNELVKLLVSRGAKLDARNDRGWSVTDMANGPSLRSSVPVPHLATVTLLLSLGAPPLTPHDNEEILGIIRQKPGARPDAKTDVKSDAKPAEPTGGASDPAK